MWIEDKLYNVLEELLPDNFTIIIGGENGVEPKAPYVAYHTLNETNVGQPYRTYSHNNNEVLTQTKEYDISMMFHITPNDQQSLDAVEFFAMALDSSFAKQMFSEQGLSYVDSNPIVFPTIHVDGTKNYKRPTLDIRVRTNITKEFKADLVKEVETTANLDDVLTHIITTDFED